MNKNSTLTTDRPAVALKQLVLRCAPNAVMAGNCNHDWIRQPDGKDCCWKCGAVKPNGNNSAERRP